GSAVAPINVAPGKVAVAPTMPTRAGFTFEGWFTDALFEKVFDWTKAVTADITLTAKWTKIVYEITFDSQGGNSVTPQSVDFETVATEPTAPTRDGYTFEGWYKEAEATTAYVWTEKVTKTMVLYAKWANAKYGVTLTLDGGTITAGDIKEYTFGDTVTLPTEVTKPGFVFGGWFTSTEYGNVVTTISATDFGEKTFYALFEEDLGATISYVQRFENSNLLPIPPSTYGSYSNRPALQLGQYKWSISAYTAFGDANDRRVGTLSARLRGSDKDVNAKDPSKNNPNRVELNSYVTGLLQVTFMYGSYSSHGGGVIKAYYQVEGSTEWLLLGSKTAQKWADVGEMSLAKFYIPKEARTQSIRFKIEKETDTTNRYTSVNIDDLTMKFAADAYNIIDFDCKGGSYVDPLLVKTNTAAYKPANPALDKNVFKGWYTDDALTTAVNWKTPVTTNMVVYAKWEPLVLQGLTLSTTGVKVNYYTEQPFNTKKLIVTANYNYNVNIVLSETDYTLSILDSANAVVADFLTAPAGTYTVKISFGEQSSTYTITKHAIPAPILDVTFNMNYPTSASQVVKVSQDDFAVIANPTRAGFLFLGWYAEEAGTTLINLETYEIKMAVIFYAKWTDVFLVDFENSIWKSVGYKGTEITDVLNYNAVGFGQMSTKDNYDKYEGTGGLRLKKQDLTCNLELKDYLSDLSSISFIFSGCGVVTATENLTQPGGILALYYMEEGSKDWVEAKREDVPVVVLDADGKVIYGTFSYSIPTTVTKPIRFKIANIGEKAVTIDNLTLTFAAK
ncbi:MAG: InlB B-repeat-containing protein, partial [Clostridia bacterium]